MSHEAEETGAGPVYESMAEDYAAELDRNPWNSLYERPGTVALLPPVAGKQVLDVGCGPGSLSAWLARNGARVTGFDASAAMVELAEKRAIPSASFVAADLAEPLAFSPTTPSTWRWPAWSCTTCGIGLPRCASCAESYDRTARSSSPPTTPASDVHLAASGNYFATELLHDRWIKKAAGTSTSPAGDGRSPTCSRQSRRPASGSSGSPSHSPSSNVAVDIRRPGLV